MYTWTYETPDFRASAYGRRAPGLGSGSALVRCLPPSSLPDPARQCPPRAGAPDRARLGLRPPDRAQCHPCLQQAGPRGPHPGLARPQDGPARLRRRGGRQAAGPPAPEPAGLWQANQPVDLGARRRRQLRRRTDPVAGQRGDHPRHPPTPGGALEAGQALDHQSGSGVRPEKSARDRLIRLASTHPTWALGFEDEVWWSRLASPALKSWVEPDQPLHLVEQTVAKDDPDPKALACYGLLVRWTQPTGDWHEEAWLRFVDGRPVSALTIPFLAWCCTNLQAAGKEALLLIWDNASWHISHAVDDWIHTHNRTVKHEGHGVRIVVCPLPVKSPWLNPIERSPTWCRLPPSESTRIASRADGLVLGTDRRRCPGRAQPPLPVITNVGAIGDELAPARSLPDLLATQS